MPQTFLGEPSRRKTFWRRNDESGIQDRFPDAISFARFMLLFFNEDAGANAFPFTFDAAAHEGARNQTGQPERRSESICSGTGAAATGWNDGLRYSGPTRQTDAGNV